LEGDVLATYPRDEVHGGVLRRTIKLGSNPKLQFEVSVDPSARGSSKSMRTTAGC
jgi:hypothetical protein